MAELKPCPFCGGRTILDASPDLDGYMEYRVECCKVYCLAHGPTRKTEAEAIAAFTMPEAVSAAVQAEREAICGIISDHVAEDARGDLLHFIRSRPAPTVDVLALARKSITIMIARHKRILDDDDCDCDSPYHSQCGRNDMLREIGEAEAALRSLVDGASPKPAVDVLEVARDFVAVIRARSDVKFTSGEWKKFDALAALVDGAAANDEGESR